MKVTGFTFIRNAVKFDFPIVEAIRSILPVCDDFVVAVGNSEDDTLGLIKGIAPDKIRIIETVWDDTLREGGKVLAQETDKAFHAIGPDTDWCFYIQGDEVVHHDYLGNIRKGMEQYLNNKEVEGLLLKYRHFHGSYDYMIIDPDAYQQEIRIVRNDKSIYSYRDAQGFRIGDNRKLKVKQLDAYVYHYSKVKAPKVLQKKHEEFGKLWNDDEWMEKNVIKAEEYDMSQDIRLLDRFTGTHPQVMEERIRLQNWDFKHDMSLNRYTLKQRIKMFLERKIGLNLSYTNYELLK